MPEPNVEDLTKPIRELGPVLVALAAKVDESASRVDATIEQSTKRLISSLNSAADAARAATASSERHARSLTWATWALVAATVVLAFVAALQLIH